MRILCLLFLAGVSLTCSAQFAVVVPEHSSIDMLSEEQVAGIFLGKTNRFPNGERAQPMELDDEMLRRLFYETMSGKSLTQLNSYWATLVFTGKGRPPKRLSGVEDMVRKLPAQPGAISYLPRKEVPEGMKVVFTHP